MAKLRLVKAGTPDVRVRQIIALLVRCNDSFLFAARTASGEEPFLQVLETSDSLPPTIAPDALMQLASAIAADIGLRAAEARSFEILTAETLRPFDNTHIHPVIFNVPEAVMDRLRSQWPESVLVTASAIIQNVGSNVFFRTIAESYHVKSGFSPPAAAS